MVNKNDLILITGANGFLGRNLVDELRAQGYKNLIEMSSWSCDLRDYDQCEQYLSQCAPDVIFAVASKVGGIQANMAAPADFFWDNIRIGANLIHAASRDRYLKKFVQVGTCCSFSDTSPIPFLEDNLFHGGAPNFSNRAYGVVKLSLYYMLEAYEQQYGMRSAYIIPMNMMGKYDSFDENKSHFVPAIIKKVADAIKLDTSYIDVWGSPEASRELIDSRDVSRALVAAMNYKGALTPINVGTGVERTIKDTVETICDVMNFKGEIRWDSSKPIGQQRRSMCIKRAKTLLNWKPTIKFKESIQTAVDYYYATHGNKTG